MYLIKEFLGIIQQKVKKKGMISHTKQSHT